MSQELPPEGQFVYVKDAQGNWESANYTAGAWMKGVENSSDDVPLGYEPVEWRFTIEG